MMPPKVNIVRNPSIKSDQVKRLRPQQVPRIEVPSSSSSSTDSPRQTLGNEPVAKCEVEEGAGHSPFLQVKRSLFRRDQSVFSESSLSSNPSIVRTHPEPDFKIQQYQRARLQRVSAFKEENKNLLTTNKQQSPSLLEQHNEIYSIEERKSVESSLNTEDIKFLVSPSEEMDSSLPAIDIPLLYKKTVEIKNLIDTMEPTLLQTPCKERSQPTAISFNDLITRYKAFPVRILNNIWKTTVLRRLCCFRTSSTLPDATQETVEKLISFGVLHFNYEDKFHSDILHTALHSLNTNSSDLHGPVPPFTDPHVPMTVYLSEQSSLLTLLLVVFINSYYPYSLAKLHDTVSRVSPILPLLIHLTTLMIVIISKKKLHPFLLECTETIELCFFFYAGLVFKAGELAESTGKLNVLLRKVLNYAGSSPGKILNLAQSYSN